MFQGGHETKGRGYLVVTIPAAIASVAALFLYSSMIVQFLSVTVLAFVIYMAIRDRKPYYEEKALPRMASWFCLSLAGVILLVAALVVSRVGLSYFYVAITIGLTIILATIIWMPREKSTAHTWALVGLLLAYSLILRANVYFSYPSIVGVDPWFHSMFIEDIVQSGSIHQSKLHEWGIYATLPVFHLLSSEGIILSGGSTKETLYLTVGVAIGLIPLWIFVAFRNLVPVKVALLAAFFTVYMSDFIRFGWWLAPSGFALCYAILILCVFVKNKHGGYRDFMTIAVVGIALSWTHPLIAVALILVCTVCVLVIRLLPRNRQSPISNDETGMSHAQFVWKVQMIGLLALIFSAKLMETGTFPFIGGLSLRLFSEDSLHIGALVSPQRTPFVTIWDRMPGLTSTALSILGVLLLLRNKKAHTRQFHFALAVSGLLLAMVVLLSYQVSPNYPLYERLFVLALLCLSGVIALALLMLVGFRRTGVVRALATLSICILIVFPVISNYSNNLGSPITTIERTYACALTENEMETASSVMSWNSTVYADFYYRMLFIYSGYGGKLNDSDNITLQASLPTSGIVLLRERYQEYSKIYVPYYWSCIVDTGSIEGYHV